jgi:hypothetical protein
MRKLVIIPFQETTDLHSVSEEIWRSIMVAFDGGSGMCWLWLGRRKRNLKSSTIISLIGNPKVFIRHKWRLSFIKIFLFLIKNSILSSSSQTPISSIRSAFCLLILARLLNLPNCPSSCPFSSSVTFCRLYLSSLPIKHLYSWIVYSLWSSTINY